jgi:hypothetical protein
MPNTLAHLGLQTLATRAVVRGADVKWVFLSCVLPDLPWIVRRALVSLVGESALYDILLYATVQASLLGCVLISVFFSAFSTKPRRVFALLAGGSLFHLLLDALQVKWGNGIHLLAPFSWKMVSFDLFWPEALPSILMTTLGLAYVLFVFLRLPAAPFDLRLPAVRPLALATVCLVLYGLGPIALLSGPERAGNRSIGTVRDVENRPGKSAAFDRVVLKPGPDGSTLQVFSGIEFRATGVGLDEGGLVSTHGYFVDRDTYHITAIHLHPGRARDIASYIGLVCVLLVWVRDLRGARSAAGSRTGDNL